MADTECGAEDPQPAPGLTPPGAAARRQLRYLRWLAILLPAAFLAAVAFGAQILLPASVPPLLAALVVAVVELVAVCCFAGFIFARIERAEADLVRQSRDQLRLARTNAALLAQTRRRADQAEALFDLSRHIAASPSSPHILESVVQRAADLLGAGAARVCLIDPDRRSLRIGARADGRALPCGASSVEDFALSAAEPVLAAGGPVDLGGRRSFCPLLEPSATSAHLAAPLRAGGRLLGAICVASPTPRDWEPEAVQLFDNLANLAAIAVQKEHLQHSQAALAILEERERIAMDLHDGIIQTIYGVGLSLEKATEQMADDPAGAAARVERAIGDLNGVIQDVRSSIVELERSEAEAVDIHVGLARLVQEAHDASGLAVALEVEPAVRSVLPASTASHLLQVAREALANVVRHSGARRADLRLRQRGDGRVELVVRDDGRGLHGPAPRQPERSGRGLANMAARARLLGGEVQLGSAPSGGTEVTLVVPATSGPLVAAEGSRR